jgi:hypothetical protein
VPIPILWLAYLLHTSLPINKYSISCFIKLTVPVWFSCSFEILNAKVFILLTGFYVLFFRITLNFHSSLLNLVELKLNSLADTLTLFFLLVMACEMLPCSHFSLIKRCSLAVSDNLLLYVQMSF